MKKEDQNANLLLSSAVNHLLRMTDDVGILEHCVFDVPDKTQGYSIDDNARALQVALKYNFPSEKKEKLILTYLKFLLSARCSKGFHNDLEPNLSWKDEGGTGEWFGRAMEALAETAILAPRPINLAATFIFDQISPFVFKSLNLRTNAHLIVALSHRLATKNSAEDRRLLQMRQKLAESKGELFGPPTVDHKTTLVKLAEELVDSYNHHRTKSWSWYEDALTYDNGRLPLGLFYAYLTVGKKTYNQIAEESLKFLLEKTYDRKNDCFSFPGYRGWFPKGGKMALFGQQPIEAGSTVEACLKAYEVTKKRDYLDYAQKAQEWYSGRNILKISLLDQNSGGVKDGLEPWGVNPNQGAESVLSYVLTCLSFQKLKR